MGHRQGMSQEHRQPSRPALFGEISSEQWKVNCPSLMMLDAADRAIIYRQGDTCEHVFGVVRGCVKLSRLTEHGHELTTALLSAGELFGCLLPRASDHKMEETATAKGGAQVCRISGTEFKALLSHHPEVAWRTIEIVSTRQRSAERKLESVLFGDVQRRVVEMLCDLASRLGEPCRHGFTIDLHLTQQELADLVGASRPVVSTVLNDLRSLGLLQYNKDAICVVQSEMFNRLIAS